MRARLAFAVLLAVGTLAHLGLVAARPGHAVVFGVFCAWLAIGAAVTGLHVARHRRAERAELGRRLLRRAAPQRTGVEGLRAFLATAAAALGLHLVLLAPIQSPRQATQGVWLVAFVMTAGLYWQLRGPAGDAGAPIPDRSRGARAVTKARRALGWALAALGGVLVLLGVASLDARADGASKTLSALLLVGGALLGAAGLIVIRAPSRNDG